MTEDIKLKNGSVLVSINDYSGETDFYAMYDIIAELLHPEHLTYGVDSLCVDGSFRINGILVRMSSDCITDQCCFHYDAASMTDEEIASVRGWIDQIVTAMHERYPR